MKKLTDYIQSVRSELAKVIWPKREEVVKLTLTVLVICTIVGFFVGALDYLFTKGLEYIISR